MTRGIWWNLLRTVASLKICTLVCYFCRKYIIFEPKKYRGVMCHNTEEWCKLWRGTDLCFEKWNDKFGEFWPNTRKPQNFHVNGLLLIKVYNIWVKTVQRSYAYYTEDRCKLWTENDLWLHKWRKELVNFPRALKNLKICTLREFFAQGI